MAKSIADPTDSARERLQALVDAHYPYGDLHVEAAGAGTARLRKRIDTRHLRPGGTVAGPTLMAIADAAVYLALQTEAPLLEAVTSQLTIHFLRKPAARDLLVRARILRRGRTLAVGEVLLYSEGEPEVVAHAMVTYALPRAEA